MPPTLTDSTVMALMDSLRHITYRADSLNSVLRAYDATRDHWLAALQTQTTIFSLVAGGLIAILVAVNWGALNVQIKRASRAEARKLGLPRGVYVPETLEEKLVAYADKLVCGSRVVDMQVTIDEFAARLGADHPAIRRLRELHEEMSGLLGDVKQF